MSSDNSIFLNNVRSLLKGDLLASFIASEKGANELLAEILEGRQEPSLTFARKIAGHLKISLERVVTKDLTKKRSDIKLLVLDVDGVLTEGGMFYAQSGDEFKRFHTRDGIAIRRLTRNGFQVAFLSSGINDKLIEARAELLGVQTVYVGLEEKYGILDGWRTSMNLRWEDICFIGDDVNDLEVMKLCGFTACPSDASEKVKMIADVILKTPGGGGCIREFVEDYMIEI